MISYKPSITDQILAGHWDLSGFVNLKNEDAFKARLIEAHTDMELVLADNVAEYYWAGTDKEEWDLGEDYPCIAPPWPKFAIEWRRPSRVVSTAGNQSSNNIPYRTAAFFLAQEIDTEIPSDVFRSKLHEFRASNEKTFADLYAAHGQELIFSVCQKYVAISHEPEFHGLDYFDLCKCLQKRFSPTEFLIIQTLLLAKSASLDQRLLEAAVRKFENDLGWAVQFCVFAQPDKHSPIIGPILTGSIFLDPTGKFKNHLIFLIADSTPSADVLARHHALSEISSAWLQVPALALSFLHTKNVVVHDETPPIADRNKWHSKEKKRLIRYKVLEIRPFQAEVRKIADISGDSTEDAMKKALHVCRGHFKDYREKGLFGKFKGIYWWDKFMRGDSDQGIVLKDYSIK